MKNNNDLRENIDFANKFYKHTEFNKRKSRENKQQK